MQRKAQDSFSTNEAAHIAGVPYATLDYWTRSKLISPSITAANGTGSDRRYSFKDLIAIRTVVELRLNGASTQSLRTAVKRLRQDGCSDPLADCKIVKIGEELCVVRGHKELV